MNAGRSIEARKFAQDYLETGNSSAHTLGSFLILAEINEIAGEFFDAATNYLKASKLSNSDIVTNREKSFIFLCFR